MGMTLCPESAPGQASPAQEHRVYKSLPTVTISSDSISS